MKNIALILFVSCSFFMSAQDRTITGKITDIKGNPLIGVTITAKDYPSITTLSGANGEYRIAVYDFTKALIFSFTKMRTKELAIGDTSRLDVVMRFKRFENPDPWSIMLYIGNGKTNVNNKTKENDTLWGGMDGKYGFFLTFELEFFMTQNIGLVSGLGIGNYRNTSYLDNFDNYGMNYLLRVDKDKDSSYLYNRVNHVNEEMRVTAINIPLKFRYRFRPGEKWSFQADAGFKFLIIQSAKIKAEGDAYWQAYYPKYHAVLADLPEYGYVNYDIGEKFSLKNHRKFNYMFSMSAQASYRLKKELNLDFGLYFEKGLSDIKYNTPAHPADFLNTIGKQDKTFLKGLGFVFGLRYHFVKDR